MDSIIIYKTGGKEMKFKKYFRTYYDSNGILSKEMGAIEFLICIFIFWILPFIAIIELTRTMFKNQRYMTEEDYYKEKLEEVKKCKT